ncbi:hypothetical protein [Limosilactobacillus reuteri]|uniref:hypothetical protein n=1 Tax=Limosilactobacillus reuteri TaxID=1598 RepID=UPI00115A06F1|nr:hypothetical protein [Limosilactobacillus reuteri]VTZ94544.1 hypothetical protein LREP572_01967 [Limosilactobacillus reuteri]
MRVMNLMIVLAVIAIIILAAQYFSQLRKNRNGNNFVSGGRVFFNWTLVAVLVICVGGIVFGSIHSHRQEAKPAQTDKTENVEYAASDSDNLGKVSVQFDRKVTLNDNGEAKVKFKVSPQTTLTIRGHKSKEIVKTFEASKGESLVNHTYTFDVAGTYDIITERGDQKVTKQLKVKGNDNTQESSSSSSSSTVSSSSSSTASTAQSNSESSSSTTAASSNNGGSSRNYNTSRPRYSGNGGGNRTSGNSTPTAPAQESSTPAYSQEKNGYVSDGPQY